ncbi:MAG: hypothetical protein Kow0077_15190 [Anaerolineae bacterium]
MALTPKQERLNRALDELLSPAELADFEAALESSAEDAAMYARLRQVDALLRQPPMAAPAPDFAARVMARIEAQEHRAYVRQSRTSRVLRWLGLLTAFVLVPLLVGMALAIPLIAQPDLFIAIFQQIVGTLGAVSAWLQRVLTVVSELIAAYPMMPALSLTIIPVVMVWAWLVWYLQHQNRPETIVIKVQVQ